MNAEKKRLSNSSELTLQWQKWGPYLSERQWGTVREDYSSNGDAWAYFPHDQARSRAYRWGEDGIGGFCDDQQLICLSVALWNGNDPILKERLFGLTNAEGNHGEDVKEYYYYLDSTPTHSYCKMLYKYPQAAFPYDELVRENNNRRKNLPEFELVDTGVFSDQCYFDTEIEYAKASPDDVLLRITAHNRGSNDSPLWILPHLWFRNTWSWSQNSARPSLQETNSSLVEVNHPKLGIYYWHCSGHEELLFTENETNTPLLFGSNESGYFKDAFHDFLIRNDRHAINPNNRGTKCCAVYALTIPAQGKKVVEVRLNQTREEKPFADFASIMQSRKAEADEFYAELQKDLKHGDKAKVQRQAFAGLLWSKQWYYYDVPQWLNGDPGQPTPPTMRHNGRNNEWGHLNNADIISMPDKWEYPWYAAWDLAFHCLPFALIDAEFAKHQLLLMTREWYMHPNGQLPAYEWNFSDVNPPVHAWAVWRVYQIDRKYSGKGDRDFLERAFHKLLLNFTWWVNRKDKDDRNIFQGGFLGLDNIGVFDRSKPLANGEYLDQADGTSWMAMYCLNLLRIALELALENRVYEDVATKFFEHFLYIAKAMNSEGIHEIGLWDDEDQFYYDVLRAPNGHSVPLKIRSMVGLTPLFAVETIEPEILERLPDFAERLRWFLQYRPDLAGLVSRWHEPGRGERRLLSLLRGHRLKALLRRMLDESEFLSDYGVRALSKFHEENPFELQCHGINQQNGNVPTTVRYQPAESDSYMFGGNSNWRGPIWFPVNYLIIESLQRFHHYYGDDFLVEYPTNSGRFLTLNDIANELSQRLAKIFLRDAQGLRPVLGHHPELNTDPHFQDHILFYEYFHGDNGRGVGASHQTGWTGLIAKLLQPKEECVH